MFNIKNFYESLLKPEVNSSKTQKTISLTIASMVNTVLNVILAMGATRLLSKIDIAINNQTILAYSTISPFLTLGITSGFYYHLTKNPKRQLAAIKECFLLVFGICFLFCFFIVLGGNKIIADLFHNSDVEYTLFYLIPYTLLITPSSICNCIFVFTNRIKFNAIFSVFQTFLILIFTCLAMFYYKNADAMLVTRVIVSCILASILLFITYKILPKDVPNVEFYSIKELVIISLPLGLASIVGSLALNLDKWLVSYLLSPEIYAVYSQAARELPLIGTITGSVSTVIIVEITKAINEKQYLNAIDLFKKAALKTSMFLMPIMVFCVVNAKTIIYFFFTEQFSEAIPTFQLYQLYMPIRVAIYGPILIALGKSNVILLKTIGDLLLNCILSIYLISIFGAKGAAIGTLISVYLLDLPITLYTICKATKLKAYEILPFKEIIICILLACPAAIASFIVEKYYFGNINTLLLIIIELFAYTTITIVIFVKYYKINTRSIINKLINKRLSND